MTKTHRSWLKQASAFLSRPKANKLSLGGRRRPAAFRIPDERRARPHALVSGVVLKRALFIAVVLSPGCASPIRIQQAVDPSEYTRCGWSGKGVFRGFTFGKKDNGDVVSGAGQQVHLDAFTTYSRAAFQAIMDGQAGGKLFPAQREAQTISFDPLMLRCRLTVTADADGNFVFTGVPFGNYLASSYISWKNADGKWVGQWNIGYAGIHGGRQRSPLTLSGIPPAPLPKAPRR